MSPADGIGIALRALNANKLRTALTLLGMVIGVAAVITLMSVGAGVQADIEERLRSTGTNLLYINPGTQSQLFGRIRDTGATSQTLTLEDAEAIDAAGIPGVVAVAPTRSSNASLVSDYGAISTQLTGVTASYAEVRDYAPAIGAFFTEQDLSRSARVIALGYGLAAELFPNGNAVGSRVRVNNQPFTVVAVMEEEGQTSPQSRDNSALVPLTSLNNRLSPQRTSHGDTIVSQISLELVDEQEATIDQATTQIGSLLRNRHGVSEDDFSIGTQQELVETISETTATLTIFLGAIAGISLLVGGIGIMNIMLVSVTERTREIGIRKAIGARRRDVLWQFLIEAVVVSLGGGLVGAALGALLSLGADQVSFGGTTLSTQLTPEPVILALSVSIIIGLVFGIYPANRASRLNPIEALRYE